MKSRPSYTEFDLHPVETGPFSTRQRRYDLKQQRNWGGSGPVAPGAFDAPAMVNPTAVAAIRKAFTQAKTSRDAWRTGKREGRIDVRQAARASRGAQDIFRRKTGQSTTRVKCSVLIDASGSMRGHNSATIAHPDDPNTKMSVTRQLAAALFGATIAKALGTVPTIDLDVYQHAAGSGRMTIKWRWSKGTPVGVFNAAAYTGIGQGANADGHAIYAITERMLRDLKRGEHGVIMVVSDGLPSVAGTGTTVAPVTKVEPVPGQVLSQTAQAMLAGAQIESQAGQALIDAVAHARKAGIIVIGVAIDGSDQSVYYGEQGTVPFVDGNWTALGSALGRTIGSALATR